MILQILMCFQYFLMSDYRNVYIYLSEAIYHNIHVIRNICETHATFIIIPHVNPYV